LFILINYADLIQSKIQNYSIYYQFIGSWFHE
jgi:hypothetical protein